MTALDQLITPWTRADAEAAIYDALAARGVSTTSWKPGAVVRTVIAGLSVVVAALSSMQAQIAKLGFLEFAAGDWLTMVARYEYGVERRAGTRATGVLTLDNTSGSVFTGSPGDLIVSSSTNGKSYRNTESYTIGSGQTGISVAFEAVEIGSASSAEAGEIETLVTALSGVEVTNAAAFVGTDAETDEDLRQRCREKLGSLSPNGLADSYAYHARTATRADGTSAGVTRVRVSADGTGTVNVYVASASGAVTGTTGDPSTDLGAVFATLSEWAVPQGVTLALETAEAVEVDVTASLVLRPAIGLTDEEAVELAEAALGRVFAVHPIGGTRIANDPGALYLDQIRACIAEALPTGAVVRLTLSAPAANVELAENEVAVLGTTTITVASRSAGEVLR